MGTEDLAKAKPGAGRDGREEILPLSGKGDAIVMLEELERRLEMQKMPIEGLSACPTQAEQCYSDTCDDYCEHCGYNVGCQDHCYCYGEWCRDYCNPVCGDYCSLCTDDGSGLC